jgi:hypothetical protein
VPFGWLTFASTFQRMFGDRAHLLARDRHTKNAFAYVKAFWSSLFLSRNGEWRARTGAPIRRN